MSEIKETLKFMGIFSVPIHNDHQKCLKFMFGNLFQFFISVSSMPYGYGLTMRIFTKISKVLFEEPRSLHVVAYEANLYI